MMNNDEMITIPMGIYRTLVAESQKLAALEATGVDNWEGYDESMAILREYDLEDQNED